MNNITRIGIKAFSVVLFALLLTAAHAAATTVSIAGVTAELGDTVTIPIMVNDITNYGSSTIRIWYDYQVVHVTDVTGSPESQVAAKYIDNSIGYASITASNLYGASGDIAFANVEFTAVGFGSSLLDLTVASLYDTTPTNIERSIIDGSITVGQVEPPKPFFVYGYVCYENGTPCNNPTVNITNLNTCEEWQTETGDGSNYYQITLSSGINLSATDVLRFDATDETNSNVTDHAVTADEVDGGGLFDFNLTIESTTDPVPYLVTYTISNTTISPNGDGIEDDTEIDVEFSEPVDATIRIENASGVIRTLYTSSDVTDPDPQTWDGTDDSSNIVADGVYQVNVTMDDGVNPVVYDNSGSITVMLDTITSASIVDITVEPGDIVTVPLMINGMTDFGTATINITYDPLVVHVTDVTDSSDSVIAASNNNNASGHTAISASNTIGASGDIVFANVEFTAVGSSGDSTPLNLDVVSLYDRSFNAIPTIVNNGSFTIQSSADPAPYLVTYTISNTTISPNGDGIEDDAEIDVEFSETVAAAIKIENATDVIKTLYTSASVKDPKPKIWDGTDDSSNIVADGTYQVNITMDDGVNPMVYDITGSITVTTSVVDPSPHLVTHTITNTTISPNGDGIMDDTEIDVGFSEPVDAAIRIENATGVVRSLYISPDAVIDPNPQTWDGTDDGGNIVAYGTYQVNVTMDDGVNPIVYDNTRLIMVANMSVATISIGDGCGIVTIPIEIGNGADVGACDIMLSYDPAIVNVTGVTGGDMDVTIPNLEHAGDGWVRIGTYQTDNPGLSGQITFANVTFAPVGSSGNCSLNLSVATFKDATPEGNEMPYVISNGTYMALLNGDVNDDGVVDMHDAMYLAKHVLGTSGFEVIITEAADVNDDKVIDIADSMHIAKYVLGITGFELR